MNTWLRRLLPVVSHGGTALLTWLLHEATNEGSVGPGEAVGIAGVAVAAVMAFWKSFEVKWKAAGGVIDGRVTDAEARAAIAAAADTLRLPDPAIKAAEALAGSAAALANGLIAWMTRNFSDNGTPEQSKPDKVALLLNAHQAISWELASDQEGSNAMATALKRLHAVWNPTQKPVPPDQLDGVLAVT